MYYHLDIANFPVESLVNIVADLLNSIIETNDKLMMTPLSSDTTTAAEVTATATATTNSSTGTPKPTLSPPVLVTRFHSRCVPKIDVHSYLTRILKFAPFSNEVLLSLLIYFDRIAKLSKKTTVYAVNSLTVHRLLITSIVVASKFTSDIFYPNQRYAKVGGIPVKELNQLELEFLFLCNFNLHVKLEELQAYGNHLLTHALARNYDTLSPASFLFHQHQQQEQHRERRMAFLLANKPSVVVHNPLQHFSTSLSAATTTTKKKRKIMSVSDDRVLHEEGRGEEGASNTNSTRTVYNAHDKRRKRRNCNAFIPKIEKKSSKTASLSPSMNHPLSYCTATTNIHETEVLSVNSHQYTEKAMKNPSISAAAAAASDSAALLVSRTILYSAVVSSPKNHSHSIF